ncbi:hypothetical protein [Flavobacterium soli]|nr:hypothetical protein [Flavobacterium soli]
MFLKIRFSKNLSIDSETIYNFKMPLAKTINTFTIKFITGRW